MVFMIILNLFLKLNRADFKAEELKKKTDENIYKFGQEFRLAHRQAFWTCPCCVTHECHFVPSIMPRELRDFKTILRGHWAVLTPAHINSLKEPLFSC